MKAQGHHGIVFVTVETLLLLMANKVRSGHTKSCGCYRKEVTAPAQGKSNIKHGLSRTKGYARFIVV